VRGLFAPSRPAAYACVAGICRSGARHINSYTSINRRVASWRVPCPRHLSADPNN